jgi:hypothetical protein
MQTIKKLTYYTDAGHGWIKVSRADLDALDIAHKITTYSYERGPWVYLEEDCDASTYMEAAKAAGWTLNLIEHYAERSTIRNFPHYTRRVTPETLIAAAERLGKLHLIHVTNTI